MSIVCSGFGETLRRDEIRDRGCWLSNLKKSKDNGKRTRQEFRIHLKTKVFEELPTVNSPATQWCPKFPKRRVDEVSLEHSSC